MGAEDVGEGPRVGVNVGVGGGDDVYWGVGEIVGVDVAAGVGVGD